MPILYITKRGTLTYILLMHMHTLLILRHGKLDLPYASHAEMPFSVLSSLGKGEMDPPVDKPFAVERITALLKEENAFAFPAHIFASPSARCITSAEVYAELVSHRTGDAPSLSTHPELREVFFDLERICPSSFSEGFSMKAVNDCVLRAMAEGTCEAATSAYSRIDTFFTKVLPRVKGPVVVITHGFLLRVMELYVMHKGAKVEEIPYIALARTHDDIYLRGFVTDHSLQEPIFIV